MRQLEGELPAKALVILLESPNDIERQLLKKILYSIGFDKYSLLQVKDSSYVKDFILEGLELAQSVFLFGHKEEALPSTKKLFQSSYSLKELNSSDQKKKDLWLKLKNWLENFN